jgi:hypothetical protein
MGRELPEEVYVREVLERRFGVVLRKLPESHLPTPDYELLLEGRREAVLEVKLIERAPRTDGNGWQKHADGSVTRKDNGPGRVGALIHNGWKQLRQYSDPKVLAFVNDETLDVLDLEEAFNGFLGYGTDETGYVLNTASRSIAEGRIREEKWGIDLYVWLDRRYAHQPLVYVFPLGAEPYGERRTEGPFLRCSTPAGYALARRFFDCPELENQRIGD